MSKILKPDPYIDQYVFEKQTDPNSVIVLKQFEKRIVDRVDYIVQLAHGQRDTITTENDWKVFEELVKFFSDQWPNEFREFKEAIPDIRSAKGAGYSKSREIMHVGSIPPRLMKLTKAIFPSQQWDKKFISKLTRRFPLFKVGGA